MDGIDTALVDCRQDQIALIDARCSLYENNLRKQIITLARETNSDLDTALQLDQLVGQAFAMAANQILSANHLSADKISAIGSHGQTVRHYPNRNPGYSLQIGNPAVIAAQTGITTVGDFRSMDVALGGQGAPLAPIFHQEVFYSPKTDRLILNIGGIANLTILPVDKGSAISGFDTGPGNLLMDAWCQEHYHAAFDESGRWASQGKFDQLLLQKLLDHPYFNLPSPKSTGREEFNPTWLASQLGDHYQQTDNKLNILSTLCEFTAESIAREIKKLKTDADVYVCGGGALNPELMTRLKNKLPKQKIESTQELGLAPAWVEAVAFAWLAKQRIDGRRIGLPQVTGASRPTQLGAIYAP